MSSSSSSPSAAPAQQSPPNNSNSSPGAVNRLVGGGSGGIEGLRGLICGTLYGLTSPLIGHPLDTVKTKMQAQSSYLQGSALRTLRTVVRDEGFLGLYRGLLPPLVGSSIFRSVQFSAYAWAFGHSKDSETLTSEIPGTGGLQVRVLTSGLIASTARALVEVPLEYVKVRRQVGQPWMAGGSAGAAVRQPVKQLGLLYTGFGVGFARTWGLMGTFFVLADTLERKQPELLAVPFLGSFIKGGVCATLAWVIVWPFEVLKNQIQAGTPGVDPSASWVTRVKHTLKHRGGVAGLYRGIGPGLLRSLVANGSSMIVFAKCQECFRSWESNSPSS